VNGERACFRRTETNSKLKQANRPSDLHGIFMRAAWMAVTLVCLCGLTGAAEAKGEKATAPESAPAADDPSATQNGSGCQIIYLGFVGALEPGDNKYSGVVRIRKTLQGKDFPDVCAKSFSPYVWTEGRDWLMTHFPSHAGALTPAELEHSPKVILVGHSMGGWAMVSVARELRDRNIPVELTIQMDSVGITDITIPRNVKSVAIFHANDVLMFMTTKHVHLEDPAQTKVVADIKVDGAGHQSITRDPRIREMVINKVESLRLDFAAKPTTIAPQAAADDASAVDKR
jgi:hypothetical protein